MASKFYKDLYYNKKSIDLLVETIKNGESVMTLWLPKSFKTRLGLLLQDQNQQNYVYDELNEDFKFIFIDINLGLDLIIDRISNFLGSKSDSIEKALIDFQGPKQLYIVVDNFTFQEPEKLDYLISLRNLNQEYVKILYLSVESQFNEKPSVEKDTSYGSLFVNIVKFPYFSRQEAEEYIRQYITSRDGEITSSQIKTIMDYAGGVPFLNEVISKEYLKLNDVEESISGDTVQACTGYVWNSFTQQEKQVISDYINDKVQDCDISEYLTEHGFVKDGSIRGTWVNQFVGSEFKTEADNKDADGHEKQYASQNLLLKDDQILFRGKSISSNFTNQERSILEALLRNKAETLSRDDIADILWGDAVAEKYSDWAIEKVISRIREKLDFAGFPASKLQTVKNVGYRLD